MVEVKKEIYGSRNSYLKKTLKDNKVIFLDNIWMFQSFQKNSTNDIFFLIENPSKKEIELFNIFIEKNKIKNYLFLLKKDNKWILKFKEEDKKILNNNFELRKFILNLTNSTLIEDSKKGSELSSDFSVFFRENMGKGFNLTDIDFYLPEFNLMIEEKTFLNSNKSGKLSIGQLLLIEKSGLLDNYISIFNNNSLSLLKPSNQYKTDDKSKWGKMLMIDNIIPFKTSNIKLFFKLLSEYKNELKQIEKSFTIEFINETKLILKNNFNNDIELYFNNDKFITLTNKEGYNSVSLYSIKTNQIENIDVNIFCKYFSQMENEEINKRKIKQTKGIEFGK